MSSGRKKVIIRRFNRDWSAGYLAPAGFVLGTGADARVELLDLTGRVVKLPVGEIKMISFVRDFHAGDPNPERLLRKTFSARPRSTGLWLRLTFLDHDHMEGLAANDLSLLESEGVLFTPPDTRSNTQRIYAPRLALSEFQVVATIGQPVRRPTPADFRAALQEDLFSAALPSASRPN